GIEVSKLAGIPDWIIRRAHEILIDLEASRPASERRAAARSVSEHHEVQMTLPQATAVENALKKLDLNTLTPLEALNKLYEFKAML
ncbi:MAG: DNA mismatch repair protein MutS, partial [Oscillospiraceae bacterium]